MELAHHMKGLKTNVGVDFVLFDGEEFVFNRGDDYFFGSKHFGSEYAKQKKNKGKVRYGAAVLLDMVGGKGVKFPVEEHSWVKAKEVCKQIWGIAGELKVDMFLNKVGDATLDDHVALQEAGIPAIDIIPPLTRDSTFGEYAYPHWHRLSDVPANCSADALADVSKVLSVWLQRIQ